MMPLNVHQWGAPENPVLLLLHGFMGNGRIWAPFVKDLKSHYFIIAPDLPGHGESLFLADDGDYAFIETAERIMTLLDRLAVQKAAVAGYSLGGRLAMHLAVYYRYRFSHLIVESASPGINNPEERKKRYEQDIDTADYIQSKDLTTFLEAWYEQPIFGNLKHHPQFTDLVASRLFNETSELARAMRGMSQGIQPPIEHELRQLNTPGLFIAGEYDEKYKTLLSRVVEDKENFKLKIIPDCGHNTHFERPQEFVQLIIEFLNTGG